MTFAKRALSFTFTLDPNSGAGGTFAGTSSNSVTLTGLRTSVEITNSGGQFLGQLRARIYGLTPSLLNQLAQIQRMPNGVLTLRFNGLSVQAGDAGTSLATIFQGMVTQSQLILHSLPESVLEVSAQAGAWSAFQKPTPNSFAGAKDAAEMLKFLAGIAYPVLAFENSSGASCILRDQYLRGSVLDQIHQVADAVADMPNGFDVKIDNGVLAIWPKGGWRVNSTVPLLSKDTGMIGYPTNEGILLCVRTQFNPSLIIGGRVQVQSTLPFANGYWNIIYVAHELESEMPNGKWFSEVRGVQVV